MRKNLSSPVNLVWQLSLVFGCLLAVTLFMVACSSMSNTPSASGMGKVTVSISDPATCQSSGGGPFKSVFVTVTDVQANVNSSAGDSDGSWVDLTPNLSKNPRQIDLLNVSTAADNCFLATLGDAMELQAGTYRMIRIMLASNSAASVSGNQCGSANNCVVVDSSTGLKTYPLLLSSEAQTGIKIPASQIAGGSLNVAAGQTEDLDIDFQTCASILQEGNGQYRLKPVLHAGVVSTTSSSINGTVLDSVSGNASTGKVEIALEQPDSGGIDRVYMTTLADPATGQFVFCPLPDGTYDIVVVAQDKSNNFYQPAILTGVKVGSTTGTIKINMPASNGNAALTALITSSDTSTPAKAIAIDATLTLLEKMGSTTYTIPLPPYPNTPQLGGGTLTVTTAASTASLTCPTATDCVQPQMNAPAGAAYLYAYGTGGPTLTTTGSALFATYTVEALAYQTGTSTRDCSVATPADLQTAPVTLAASTTYPLSVTGTGMTAKPLAFTSCQ
jgi:hypothetical protein